MKALILAAGYGTRLEKDIRSDTTGAYAHLLGVPKPLLPIGGKPLISRWVEDLRASGLFSCIYVVTNAYNHAMFEEWRKQYGAAAPTIELVSDGSTNNDNRIGAVAAIKLCRDHFQVHHDDLLVIGGDTLFLPEFDLKQVLTEFLHRLRRKGASLLLAYTTDDAGTSKVGILEVDERNEVTAFLEKPGPNGTTSRLACPCFYLLSSLALLELDNFMEQTRDKPLEARDAPGHFIKFLTTRLPCYVVKISGRFDVGGLETYKECDAAFAPPKPALNGRGGNATNLVLGLALALVLRAALCKPAHYCPHCHG